MNDPTFPGHDAALFIRRLAVPANERADKDRVSFISATFSYKSISKGHTATRTAKKHSDHAGVTSRKCYYFCVVLPSKTIAINKDFPSSGPKLSL